LGWPATDDQRARGANRIQRAQWQLTGEILLVGMISKSAPPSGMWKRKDVLIQVDIHKRMNYTSGTAEGRGGEAYEQGYVYINVCFL